VGRDADPVDTNRCVKEGVIVMDLYKLASDLKTTCLPEYSLDSDSHRQAKSSDIWLSVSMTPLTLPKRVSPDSVRNDSILIVRQ